MPRHDLDALSLLAGVALAGLGLASLLSDGVGIDPVGRGRCSSSSAA